MEFLKGFAATSLGCKNSSGSEHNSGNALGQIYDMFMPPQKQVELVHFMHHLAEAKSGLCGSLQIDLNCSWLNSAMADI